MARKRVVRRPIRAGYAKFVISHGGASNEDYTSEIGYAPRLWSGIQSVEWRQVDGAWNSFQNPSFGILRTEDGIMSASRG